jgi:hypothetical protein
VPKNANVFVSSLDVAAKAAFIYAILEPTLAALYIGQTRSRYGALGRLSQHLSEDSSCNTFKQRIDANFSILGKAPSNVQFISIPLTPLQSFYSTAADYREAVEALVQDKIVEFVTTQQLVVSVVSRVSYNNYRKEIFIQEEAERVFCDLQTWLIATCSSSGIQGPLGAVPLCVTCGK